MANANGTATLTSNKNPHFKFAEASGNHPEVTSFIDAHGATVCIPSDQIGAYAITRTEQVTVLTNLIANHVAGNQIDLSELDVCVFAGLTNELAHAATSAVTAIAELASATSKGGVQ